MQNRGDFFAIHLRANTIQIPNFNHRPTNSLAFIVLVISLPCSSEFKSSVHSMDVILRSKNDYRLIIMIALPAWAIGNQDDK